ncbi:FecR family protein [Lachnospiraceae bacterium G11]|nr:FecR family protein [Lachnospiraceae bacterium G11]
MKVKGKEMGENEKKKFSLSKKQLIIIGAVAAAVVIGVVLFIVLNNNSLKATTMKLLRMEGTVTLEENGETKTVKENLRFKSGDAVSTEAKSLVSVGLDDTKIVTLDEESRAEFQKDGKNLELTLTDGQLFFNVTEKLDADASFNIRNSDMVVGIRGTSGVYTIDEYGRPALFLTDGVVEITATNPETGESKTITLQPGTRVSVYFYSDRPLGQTVEFYETEMTPDMLPDFAVTQIYSDEDLINRVTQDTGWTVTDISKLNDDVQNGTYKQKESEPINLGLMDPDDLIPKDPETDKEEEPAEEPEEPEEPEQPEEPEAPAEEPKEEEGEPQVQEPIDYAELGRNDPDVIAAIKLIDENGLIYLSDGTIFDWKYYAEKYPEIARAYGNDPYALLYHYIHIGKKEDSRYPSLEEEHQVAAKKVEEQRAAEQFQKEQEEANRRAAEESEESTSTSTRGMRTVSTSSITNAWLIANSGQGGASISFGYPGNSLPLSGNTCTVEGITFTCQLADDQGTAAAITGASFSVEFDGDTPVSWNGHPFEEDGGGALQAEGNDVVVNYESGAWSVAFKG